MHMKQSPYQLHPQQFLSSSSSFYIMLHMCILWCVSNFFAYAKKTYSEKYEWASLLLLSELSISALPSHSCLHVQELHTDRHRHTQYVTGSEKRGHFGAKFFSIFLAKHEVYLFSFNMNYNLPFKSL